MKIIHFADLHIGSKFEYRIILKLNSILNLEMHLNYIAYCYLNRKKVRKCTKKEKDCFVYRAKSCNL